MKASKYNESIIGLRTNVLVQYNVIDLLFHIKAYH